MILANLKQGRFSLIYCQPSFLVVPSSGVTTTFHPPLCSLQIPPCLYPPLTAAPEAVIVNLGFHQSCLVSSDLHWTSFLLQPSQTPELWTIMNKDTVNILIYNQPTNTSTPVVSWLVGLFCKWLTSCNIKSGPSCRHVKCYSMRQSQTVSVSSIAASLRPLV